MIKLDLQTGRYIINFLFYITRLIIPFLCIKLGSIYNTLVDYYVKNYCRRFRLVDNNFDWYSYRFKEITYTNHINDLLYSIDSNSDNYISIPSIYVLALILDNLKTTYWCNIVPYINYSVIPIIYDHNIWVNVIKNISSPAIIPYSINNDKSWYEYILYSQDFVWEDKSYLILPLLAIPLLLYSGINCYVKV